MLLNNRLIRPAMCAIASLLALLAAGYPQPGKAAAPTDQTPEVAIPRETPEQRDRRMAWWREARFGMFIHWGLYAVPAGVWNGQPVGGVGEWIMNYAFIPVEEYRKLAPQFNPVNYDPVEWARLAKEAGMKYLVITAKHHDGFCLFETKATDWNVVDATPYGRDLLKPLAEECRKLGIKFCAYYSIMDWHHPSQKPGSETRYSPTKMREGRKDEYVAFMKKQLRELIELTDPELLWFDGEWPAWWEESDGRDLERYLRDLKPSLIINNRVGKGRKGMDGISRDDQEYAGDFGTPEQRIPATGLPGVDWESCMTMNDTWGFKSDDHNWKSVELLLFQLVDSVSKGGNYLLNVGPTADGLIPAPSVERLRTIGRWLEVNGESIYGAGPTPGGTWPFRCTSKPGRLFLHLFEWPEDGRLVIPGLQNKIQGAHLLADPDRQPLKVSADSSGPLVHLPSKGLDPINSVVVLKIEGEPEVVE